MQSESFEIIHRNTTIPVELVEGGKCLVERDHAILFKKNNCKLCYGRGEYTTLVSRSITQSNGHRVKTNEKMSHVCGCAVQRLQKRLPKTWTVKRLVYSWEDLQRTNEGGENARKYAVSARGDSGSSEEEQGGAPCDCEGSSEGVQGETGECSCIETGGFESREESGSDGSMDAPDTPS